METKKMTREERYDRLQAIVLDTTGENYNKLADRFMIRMLSKLSNSMAFGWHIDTDQVIACFEQMIEETQKEVEDAQQ